VEQLEGEDGWVSLGMIGTRLIDVFPDFDSRTYGFRKLSDLVRKLDVFETGNSGNALTIRRRKPEPEKPAAKKAAPKKPAPEKPAPETSAPKKAAPRRARRAPSADDTE
jgi:Fe-S-cluster formation regulator IscX/YfhJ